MTQKYVVVKLTRFEADVAVSLIENALAAGWDGKRANAAARANAKIEKALNL